MNLDEQLFIQESRWRGRLITLGVLATLGLVVGVLVYVFFFRSEATKARPTEDLKVGRATINANLIISGKADAQLISDLSFRTSGTVETVDVKVGEAVHQGDVLASLESADLANGVASAQASLALARARLTELEQGATDSQRAAAQQSLVTAQVGVSRAGRDVSDLLKPPTQVQLTTADQAVASAQAALNQAQRDHTSLINGPTSAQIASANQVVSSAQVALNQAQRRLDDLRAGATASQLAAAQQQLDAANANLASAQASLARLTAPPSDAQLASAQSAVAAAQASFARLTAPPSDAQLASAQSAVAGAQQGLNSAQNALDNARSNVNSTEAAVRAARSAYCLAAPSDPLCGSATLPLPSSTVNNLLAKLSNPSTDPSLLSPINSLIQTNTGYVVALNSVDTASGAVSTAQAQLASAQAALTALQAGPSGTDLAAAQAQLAAAQAALTALQTGPTDTDRAAAQAAVTAAQQNRDLAQLNLDNLRAGPLANDVANAEDAVRSAQAVLDAAVAQHDHLVAPPTADDLARADDAIGAAQAALDAAVAKRDDLLGGASASSLAAARDAERSAQASLNSAIANETDTAQGPRDSQLEQQRQSVRIAQLAVSAAQLRVRDAQIISPFDGTVAALSLKLGEFTGVGSATPAIVLLTPNAIVLKMNLGETDYPNVKLDQKGIVTFDALPGKPYPFTVSELGLSPTVTQGVVTYEVTGALVIPPESPRPAPGMSANGQIITDSRPDVIAIPPRAIRRRGADQVVDVRRNGTVEEQVISTGLSDTDNVEVLTGLNQGDVLVVPVLLSSSSSKPQQQPTLPSGIR
jgi:RND family efflux transporter MFP subunit